MLFFTDPCSSSLSGSCIIGHHHQYLHQGRFITKGGVQITCQVDDVLEPTKEVEALLDGLNSHEGVILASSYEFPGRYARWTLGFIDPPLKIESRGLDFTVTALNDRGKVLLPVIDEALKGENGLALVELKMEGMVLRGKVS